MGRVVNTSAGAHRSRKRALEPLELEFQTDVRLPTLLLRTKLRSSATVAHKNAEPTLQALEILLKGTTDK